MSDLESAEQYLKIEIIWIKKKICLIQTEYIMNMLKYFDMKNCISKFIFMKKKIQLNIDIADKSLCKTDKEHYQQMIKSLLYLSLKTKSNILFAVMILSWFTVNFYEKYETALNQIFYKILITQLFEKRLYSCSFLNSIILINIFDLCEWDNNSELMFARLKN